MQGRFKRDGSASAEPEPHNGTARGASPQHAQPPGQGQAADEAAPALKPAGSGSTGPGARMALRNWRISTRLVSLLALPVVAATTLGGLRISDSLEDMQQLENMQLLTEMTKQATELANALQEERDVTAGPLAHGAKDSDYKVRTPREKTDKAKDQFLKDTETVDDNLGEGDLQGVRDSLVGLIVELRGLDKLRENAYDAEGNSTQTVESYHRLITQLLELSTDMAEATSNPEMIQHTRALAAFSSAKEYASMQRAVIAASLPKDASSFADLSENDRLYGEAAREGEKSELDTFGTIYGSGQQKMLEPLENNSVIEVADKYSNTVLSPNGSRNVGKQSYQDWVDDASTKLESMGSIEHTLLEEMEQKARELQDEAQREALISGVLILLVLGVSLVGAFVVARSMIRSLRRLQDTATKVAKDRLPELVKQLSESDPQDVDTTVESVGVHSRDEIGQVAAAFDDVHREAVRLAAEQALLRGNVNAMFTNLSRRSQGLIQRQLTLISELESREADPDQLSSLFKLDHLATRMRRNGENLLVLAGEEPGRRWTRPVPLVDVLRAAASEVEQYERIELATVPQTEIAGRVVNDLVHLLAELLENATSFSSPQTKVRVTGHALPDGRALIEIHDTGIGLSPEDLSAINERLAAPPTVDVSVSRRMGLFVVGRLSQRHGIRIQLRPSDSGGTTALVMLPVDVAQGDKKAPVGKGGQGGGGVAAAAAGAAAARRSTGAAIAAPPRPAAAPARRSARDRRPVRRCPAVTPAPAASATRAVPAASARAAPVRVVPVRVPASAAPPRRPRQDRPRRAVSRPLPPRSRAAAPSRRSAPPPPRTPASRARAWARVRAWARAWARVRAWARAPARGSRTARRAAAPASASPSCRRPASSAPSCRAAPPSSPTLRVATTTSARPRRCRASRTTGRAPRPSSPARTSTPPPRSSSLRRPAAGTPSRAAVRRPRRPPSTAAPAASTRSRGTATSRRTRRRPDSSRPTRRRPASSRSRASTRPRTPRAPASSPSRRRTGTPSRRSTAATARSSSPPRATCRRPPAAPTAVLRCSTRWRPTGSAVSRRSSRASSTGRSSRRPAAPARSSRRPARPGSHSSRRPSRAGRSSRASSSRSSGPAPGPRPSGRPPPPGAARPTTSCPARPSAPASPARAASPRPACRSGCPRRTSSRAPRSRTSTPAGRRSPARPTPCEAG